MSKRHQPQPPGTVATPPALTIGDLPDACLVHCLAFLPPEDRFKTAALVSKRFRSLTCSPELLACLKIGLKKQPAADALDDTHRLHALQLWLLRHAGSLRQLELTVDMSANTSPLALLLDGCIAAAGSAGTLQRLTLMDANEQAATATAYILGSWAQSMSGLRHLSIQANRSLWLPPTLQGLSQLDSLSLEASDLKVTATQPPGLPRSLTKLCLTQRDFRQTIVTPLQIGSLTNLVTLELLGSDDAGLIDCRGALVAGISALHSTLRHLALDNAKLSGGWLPASLQHLSALQVLCVSSDAYSARQGQLNRALQQLPQLTGLLLEGTMSGSPPPAIAAMSQLQWLHLGCDFLDGNYSLPAGPYQSSLCHLVASFYTVAASEAALGGMPRLERLSLTEPPYKMEDWDGFWDWAASHPPLRILEYMDETEWHENAEHVSTETLNQVVQLVRRRPSLQVQGLPYTGRGYAAELLSDW